MAADFDKRASRLRITRDPKERKRLLKEIRKEKEAQREADAVRVLKETRKKVPEHQGLVAALGLHRRQIVKVLHNKRARFLGKAFHARLLNLLDLVEHYGSVRPLSDWKPSKAKSPEAQFRSFVRHALCLYPVPQFLFASLGDNSERHEYWQNFLAEVGQGKSAYKTAKKLIPVPLTKAMVHNLMQSKAQESVGFALRRVQVEAATTDPSWALRLHKAIMGTFLHRLPTHGSDGWGDFYFTVIQWFGRQPLLNPSQVGPLLDYIRHLRRQDPTWTVVGRSPQALMEGMRRWHTELALVDSVQSAVFTPCGLSPGLWRGPAAGDNYGPDALYQYVMVELLSTKALRKEGRAQSHCVLSYAPDVEKGKCSIWSLRRTLVRRIVKEPEEGPPVTHYASMESPQSLLTLEVLSKPHRIVQIRGKHNRLARTEEMKWVNKWSALNDIKRVSRWC